MKPSELVELHGAIGALWPSRLVDPLDEAQARFVTGALFADVPLEEALVVVQDVARQARPFPPAWPEIREAWQARRSGVANDPALIANEWLAEVDRAVHRYGSYRRPEWSDPIIGAAVEQAAGSWQGWCLTPTGGEDADGSFVRNLAPERDERFRRAAAAMIRHRRETGESLPQIVERRRRQARLESGLRRLGERSDS